MEKDFEEWSSLKRTINNRIIDNKERGSKNNLFFQEREMWWTSVGLNVGFEIDGKNEKYSRPVLIVRKFNNRFFLGVPLTTKIKENPFYVPFIHNDKERCAMTSQVKSYDSKRLDRKLGRMSEEDFNKIRVALVSMILN